MATLILYIICIYYGKELKVTVFSVLTGNVELVFLAVTLCINHGVRISNLHEAGVLDACGLYTLCNKIKSFKFSVWNQKWWKRKHGVIIPVIHNILEYVSIWLFFFYYYY